MKHNYILVKLEHYIDYVKENGHNRLDRWNRIWAPSKSKMLYELSTGKIYEEEIFSGIETEYKIENNVILFKCNSNTEYRFDLIKEPNENIYHLGFSLSDNDLDNSDEYEKPTNKQESLEVLNRLIWILKDIDKNIEVDEYCIGSTGNNKKDRIYEYILNYVSSWEKRDCSAYKEGWALYFKI